MTAPAVRMVGYFDPGALTTVFAVCCARCARVILVPPSGAVEGGPSGSDIRRSSYTVAAAGRAIRRRGWRFVAGDEVRPGVWICPGCATEADQPYQWGRPKE